MKTTRHKRSGGFSYKFQHLDVPSKLEINTKGACIFHLILVGILLILILSFKNRVVVVVVRGGGGWLLNGQNPLSMTKVICRQPLTTILFNRYYLQNCKAIAFRKIAIIPNRNKVCSKSSSYFLIEFGYCGASSIPSVLDETDFQKILTGVLSEGQGHV